MGSLKKMFSKIKAKRGAKTSEELTGIPAGQTQAAQPKQAGGPRQPAPNLGTAKTPLGGGSLR
jgi:hypothetical protein